MTGNEIREMFLKFFESKGHRRVPSSSLVPHGDATLLFTNAGMNQFKDVFLGLEKREYARATTAQKCVRAGGKHNDLENVGFTKRHHTFFEMMGNFSFGDYFKKDAVAYAWELITAPQWFAIAKDKLYVTIFKGENNVPRDAEAAEHWIAQGVPADRIFEMGAKDNFWAMGDTGPCGPCSEIHYDMGPEASDSGHADCKFPCDCGRYVEIWNLVFMQFNRDSSGTLTPLPKPSIDTGAGLERLAAVLQGVISNYDTDLFQPIIKNAGELTGSEYGKDPKSDASLRIIADHARATSFLITDGVLPSNEGRGYVLRKIMRRAIRHGYQLGMKVPFLHLLVFVVKNHMELAYPELSAASMQVGKVVLAEEKRFGHTVGIGLRRLQEDLQPLIAVKQSGAYEKLRNETEGVIQVGSARGKDVIADQIAKARSELIYSGYAAFRLYDTFGLPLDFIVDAVRDAGLWFDEAQFNKAMAEQRTLARASWKGGAGKESANPAYGKLAETFKTELAFYHDTTAKDCLIEAILTKSGSVYELKPGETGEVVLDRTVIYAESGGQIADTGWFYDPSGSQPLAEVTGAFYPVAGLVAHKVKAKEALHVGDRITVVADAERREHIKRHHTGTHLLHAALRNTLGTHVKQAGSLNGVGRLRFDFSHFAPIDAEELRDIEQQVNEEIRLNTAVTTDVTSLEDALASGALAFFGDKYPESNVRVVTIPDSRVSRGFYSKELCGGTHVTRVGDIGVLKIVNEESVAAGVRRIEAVTGNWALEHYQRQAATLHEIAAKLNVGEDAILATVEKLSLTAKQLEKDLEAQKRKGALGQLDELVAKTQTIKGVKVIVSEVGSIDREGLRQMVDTLRQKLGSGVVVLGMPEDGKVALIAGVTKDLTAKVHAGKLIQALAKQVGGSGGGRPDLAEAGGKDTSALKSALSAIPSYLDPLL